MDAVIGLDMRPEHAYCRHNRNRIHSVSTNIFGCTLNKAKTVRDFQISLHLDKTRRTLWERKRKRERGRERERDNKGRQLYLWLKVADILGGSCTADTKLPFLPLWLALCLGFSWTTPNMPQLSTTNSPLPIPFFLYHNSIPNCLVGMPRFAASLIGALFVVIGGLRRPTRLHRQRLCVASYR